MSSNYYLRTFGQLVNNDVHVKTEHQLLFVKVIFWPFRYSDFAFHSQETGFPVQWKPYFPMLVSVSEVVLVLWVTIICAFYKFPLYTTRLFSPHIVDAR